MNKKIDAKKKRTRRSLSLVVAPTKSGGMRMMLINEDNERTYLIRTRIPLRWESITEKEKNPFGHPYFSILCIYSNDPFIDEKNFHSKTR
jgi:hypothetical protein